VHLRLHAKSNQVNLPSILTNRFKEQMAYQRKSSRPTRSITYLSFVIRSKSSKKTSIFWKDKEATKSSTI